MSQKQQIQRYNPQNQQTQSYKSYKKNNFDNTNHKTSFSKVPTTKKTPNSITQIPIALRFTMANHNNTKSIHSKHKEIAYHQHYISQNTKHSPTKHKIHLTSIPQSTKHISQAHKTLSSLNFNNNRPQK